MPIMSAHGLRPRRTRQSELRFTNEVTGPTIYIAPSVPTPTVVFDTYWRFAAERQAIFFRRLLGQQVPWTDDPVLRRFKFTNAYRASDRVSQYLIRKVIYDGDEDPVEVFFRTI